MEALASFLDMGGYADFVWPAFALTAVILAGLLVTSLRTLRTREAALEALRTTKRERTRPVHET